MPSLGFPIPCLALRPRDLAKELPRLCFRRFLMKPIIAAMAIMFLSYASFGTYGTSGQGDPCTKTNPNAELLGPFCYEHAPTLHEWSGEIVPHCTEVAAAETCFDYAIFNGTSWRLGILQVANNGCTVHLPSRGGRVEFCTEVYREGVLCRMRDFNGTNRPDGKVGKCDKCGFSLRTDEPTTCRECNNQEGRA